MLALADACDEDRFPARIALVVSDKADAGGLAAARARGIEAVAVPRSDHASRADHEAAVQATLVRSGARIICLAGYMRLLSAEFLVPWQGRIINIHPSLLPRHKGLDTHARAIAAGDTEHGCSVHHVTPGMDEGPVIAQARVPVLAGDTAETLAARVLLEEHRLYPAALARLIADLP